MAAYRRDVFGHDEELRLREEPVLASTDGAIMTPSFTAVYLERDGGDKYVLGEAANIHRESVVRALEASECFEAEDDTRDTVLAVFHIQRSVQATLKREQVHLAGGMMIDRPHQRTRHDKRMSSRRDPDSASRAKMNSDRTNPNDWRRHHGVDKSSLKGMLTL